MSEPRQPSSESQYTLQKGTIDRSDVMELCRWTKSQATRRKVSVMAPGRFRTSAHRTRIARCPNPQDHEIAGDFYARPARARRSYGAHRRAGTTCALRTNLRAMGVGRRVRTARQPAEYQEVPCNHDLPGSNRARPRDLGGQPVIRGNTRAHARRSRFPRARGNNGEDLGRLPGVDPRRRAVIAFAAAAAAGEDLSAPPPLLPEIKVA